MKRVSSWLRPLVRHLAPRQLAPRREDPVARCERVAAALGELARSGEPEEDGVEPPIFLLASGWRTGSTLLQRILMTDRRLLLWGEPLGRMALLRRIADMLCGISSAWPPREYWIDQRPHESDLTTEWIANLFPPAGDLHAGLRRLFDRWLRFPAQALGYERWGFKEVRLGLAEALVLRWLYPNSHIVALVRHPAAAYRSMKGAAEGWWLYARWPDERIDCVTTFARHWERLAASWATTREDLPTTVVRYETLTAPGYDFAALSRSLGLKLDPSHALEARVGGTSAPTLSRLERVILRRETRQGRARFRYEESE